MTFKKYLRIFKGNFLLLQKNCNYSHSLLNGFNGKRRVGAKSDLFKNVLESYKACFCTLNIFCNFSRSLFIIKKSRKPVLTVNGGSELKSVCYKNLLEFSKATFCFYLNFCHYAGSTLFPITHSLTESISTLSFEYM